MKANQESLEECTSCFFCTSTGTASFGGSLPCRAWWREARTFFSPYFFRAAYQGPTSSVRETKSKNNCDSWGLWDVPVDWPVSYLLSSKNDPVYVFYNSNFAFFFCFWRRRRVWWCGVVDVTRHTRGVLVLEHDAIRLYPVLRRGTTSSCVSLDGNLSELMC